VLLFYENADLPWCLCVTGTRQGKEGPGASAVLPKGESAVLPKQAIWCVGIDGEAERAAELQPDRYYLLSDAGSFFFELDATRHHGVTLHDSPRRYATNVYCERVDPNR
jgi:hypothetical protein